MKETKLSTNEIMKKLAALGKETTKRTYINHGAKEPLYGVTSGALKPLAKMIGIQQSLAMDLYATGNYDAMYLAGMIADVNVMKIEDYELWMKTAYCYAISDYIVAVTLTKAPFAQQLADKWIASDQEVYNSAGWACYEWLLGYKADDAFSRKKILHYLKIIETTIHEQASHIRYVMNNFVIAVGVSYQPLHEEAIAVANTIGIVSVDMNKTNCKTPLASASIQKAIDKNRIGFKRKDVRC